MKTKIDIIFVNIVLINVSFIYCFNIDFKELNNYLDEEKSILDLFDAYLSSEENRIFRLRQTYEHFRQQNTIALKDKQLFLSHPNDVYFLIKRLTIGWKEVDELLEPNKEIERTFLNKRIIRSKLNYLDTVKSYENLLYFYDLNIRFAANGVLKYKTSSGDHKVFKSVSNQTFDAFDCYSIGKQSFINIDFFAADEWFAEALIRVDNETSAELKADIFQYLSLTEYNLGEIPDSIKSMSSALSLSKDRPVSQQLLDNMKMMDKKAESRKMVDFNNEVNLFSNNNQYDQAQLSITGRNKYLCRGKKLMNGTIESKLKCFYLNTTLRPYLRLTRIRVEELYKRPQILKIHNFLSETEVQTLKNISEPVLSRATIVNETGHLEYDDYRIAQSEFLKEDLTSNSVINIINRRITHITRLNASDSSSDYLNIIKYNVGGLYDYHDDSTDDENNRVYGRLITWINYLSDVSGGGATVFPHHNVSSIPEKYSAVFWYNHFSDGKMDEDMYHSGCPLFYGDKWIATKWIRIRGQSYEKCSPDRNERKILN